ncbi:uncharacterized protein LOC124457026 [Xenia sp. Carnegie-2017]|uniref:uncharacterized protein LOC124457026 n=1 Tax=Xenia sp. Carnegie-2017 TaxID=2897299 RepID=UPI001F03E3E8|nr:uncharacterized protein LOC124457026 [Xenia sp. Carnegie-2017]
MVAKDLMRMSKKFIDEAQQLVKQLSDRRTDLENFANFIKVHGKIKKKVSFLQVEVEYMKSIFEMIRASQRPLSEKEKEIEDATCLSWEQLLFCLEEASNFLVYKIPEIMCDLDDKIMRSN